MDFSTGGWLIMSQPNGLLILGDHLFLNYKKKLGRGGWLIPRGLLILTWHYIYTHIIRDISYSFFLGMHPSPINGMYWNSRLGIIYIYVFHDLARMLVRILVRIYNVISPFEAGLKLFSLICSVANLTLKSLTNGERLKTTLFHVKNDDAPWGFGVLIFETYPYH